jgi:4-hydroxy-3-polyprenylbenzoate decarboxylase
MCVYGTKKFEEETDESYRLEVRDSGFDFPSSQFPEIKAVNSALLQKEIPVLIISVEKNRKGHLRELHQQVCDLKEL